MGIRKVTQAEAKEGQKRKARRKAMQKRRLMAATPGKASRKSMYNMKKK